jgi:Adenine-specific methyltransferase EcoRI
MANELLVKARENSNDEFYTQYHDIEKEMNAYLDFDKDVFRGKTVLLPCDDPEWSNFTKYFAQNFTKLGLKKLISTSYSLNSKPENLALEPTLFELESPKYDATKSYENGRILVLDSDTNGDGVINFEDLEWSYLQGNGDFASAEVTALRDQSDIIVTNPPFSLFRKFLAWIIEGGKEFSVIGNMNAITYKEVFPQIQQNNLWIGATNFNVGMYFFVPESWQFSETYRFNRELMGRKASRVPGVCWYTNLRHGKRHEPLQLMSEADNIRFGKSVIKGVGYKKYENYDAIEVPYTESIPSDYEGVMGVPISFLGKYNPDQFEIVDLNPHFFSLVSAGQSKPSQLKIKGQKDPYARVLIRHRAI